MLCQTRAMTTQPRTSPVDTPALWAGLALIALPLLATLVRLAWPGWYLVIILMISPVLIIGYILQVVIAANGFLSARGVLRAASVRRRALIAAWLSAAGCLVTSFFFVDGGDSDWGSAFMHVIGAASDDAMGNVSAVVSLLAGIAWIGGWLWLLVEWITALVRARKASKLATV